MSENDAAKTDLKRFQFGVTVLIKIKWIVFSYERHMIWLGVVFSTAFLKICSILKYSIFSFNITIIFLTFNQVKSNRNINLIHVVISFGILAAFNWITILRYQRCTQLDTSVDYLKKSNHSKINYSEYQWLTKMMHTLAFKKCNGTHLLNKMK